CKIVLGESGRCRERLTSNGGAIELAIVIIDQDLRDLQDSAFGFLFVQSCQLIERENRKPDEGQGQSKRKQGQECPDSLWRHPVTDQSLRPLGLPPSLQRARNTLGQALMSQAPRRL